MERTKLVRGLRIAWSVWWGIVCVLLVALWVRSFGQYDAAIVRIPSNGVASATSFFGRILLGRIPESIASGAYVYGSAPTGTWEFSSVPIVAPHGEAQAQMLELRGFPGFGFFSNPTVSGFYRLDLPHWFLVFLSASLAMVPWINQTKRFSLRTLLIATTLIAVVLGLIVWSSS